MAKDFKQVLEIVNDKLAEHSEASGYGKVKKSREGASSSDGPARHSESAKITMANQSGKPSTRAAFQSAHPASPSSGPKKPVAPAPPQRPKPVMPLGPMKPLVPIKPKM